MLPALLGKTTKGRDYVITSAGALSIYDGKWKYISPSNRTAFNKLTGIHLGNSPEDQLYHIKNDVSEQHNIASQHPDEVERLKHILETEKQSN